MDVLRLISAVQQSLHIAKQNTLSDRTVDLFASVSISWRG
uniref:Uncharacterized protein n=1 Tax=Anguilla anguilla TaxID=7936 RepID=A0A0E9UYE9_ANGAN